MKAKLKNKFAEMKEKEGHIQIGESMTDQSQAEDTDIYKCIEKYGIQSLIRQTEAKEFLYLDNTNRNLTLDEALRQKEQMNEYFKNLPARVRKQFGDDIEIFYQKYNRGEFDEMLNHGILSKEQVQAIGEIGGLNEQDIKDIISNEGIFTDTNQGDNTTL